MAFPRSLAGLLLAVSAAASAHGLPRLEVSPRDAGADTPVSIQVDGLRPTERVRLTLSTRDTHGRRWSARANYRADLDGHLDLAASAPLTGSYHGAHAMGLFWSMQPDDGKPGSFVQPWRRDPASGRFLPLHYRLQAHAGGRLLGRVTLTRQLTAPGVRVQHLRNRTLSADLYLPATDHGGHRLPAVVTLDGAEGGIEAADRYASWLASHGYVALAVGWYHMKGLPRDLVRVPIAPVERGVALLRARADVDPQRIGVMGGSWGAILAMLVGATDPQVHAVVSWVGGPVLWNGLRRDVPPADFHAALRQPPFLVHGHATGFVSAPDYERYLKTHDRAILEPGLIPIWRIHGPLMMVAGGDDGMEQSGQMAALAMQLLREHHHDQPDRTLYFADAGHLIWPGYAPVRGLAAALPGLPPVGGSPGGYARADAPSGPAVLAFLARALPGAGG